MPQCFMPADAVASAAPMPSGREQHNAACNVTVGQTGTCVPNRAAVAALEL